MSSETPATKWSTFQESIFNWNKQNHLMIEAGAGCGKTSTIVELYKRLISSEPQSTIQFLAFNKKIADELSLKGVPAATMNSFGNRIIKRHFPFAKLETNKIRNLCKKFNVPYNKIGLVSRCVDLMKGYLFANPIVGDGTAIKVKQLEMDFELCEEPLDDTLAARVVEVFRSSLEDTSTYDFADQICFPIYHQLSSPKFKYVIVDEAQDMSPSKLTLVANAVDPLKGKFICVGDPHQAIYGFAGADSESMNKIRTQFDPVVMNLPVTYRCGKAIVKEAHYRKVAPELFQAGPDNHEGAVHHISTGEFDQKVQPKDFVLCRVSSPLVSNCFRLIKKNIRAQILGKDVGKKLVDLVDKISESYACTTLTYWLECFKTYSDKEIAKLRKAEKDTQADNLEDQLECLWVFTDGAQNIGILKLRLSFSSTIPSVRTV